MGDPRKLRKKYSGPLHPWKRARIESEREIVKEYGLKNKNEVWKSESLLKNFAAQAKNLIAIKTAQGEIEKSQLFRRLEKFGLVKPGAPLDAILELTLKDILNRRLQTVVIKKGFARSPKQARQFITHCHIAIGNKLVTSPSHMVTVEEEPLVSFLESSALSKPDHPERMQEKTVKPETKLPEVKE